MKPTPATFIEWSRDGVGRLKIIETGEVLRVGASACGFLPEVGLTVDVLGIAPHPLGGNKAIALQLRAGTDTIALLDRAQPLPGLNDVALFVEHTDAVGILGVITGAPIRSRVELRDWVSRHGAEVDFSNPDRPTVKVGRVPYRLFVVNGAFPMGGQSVVSFAATSFHSIKKGREIRSEPALVAEDVEPLVSLVRRCAENERAVIAHQAPGALWASDVWRATEPLRSLLFVSEPNPGTVTLTGLAPFLLPDLFTKSAIAADMLHAAAAELVKLGSAWRSVEALGGLKIVRASYEWIELSK